jgi:hypothetical protein
VSSLSRGLISDTPTLDEHTLFVRPVKIGRQLTIEVSIEDIQTKKQVKATALIDSGCMRTCIDEEFAKKAGLVLQRIANPIRVEYVDGTSVEDSTIRYSTDIRIRTARAMVVTRALVTRLKSAKVFLGFDWLQSVNPRINWREFCVEADEDAEVLKMRSTKTTPKYSEIFERAFSEDGFKDLPPRQKWDHAINLKDGHGPIRGRCYPLAYREKDALKEFISTNEASGKIRKSDLPYASPFFFRPKPGTGELRGIQDYRKLNEATVKDQYPLPLIQDVLNRAQGSKVFTKMDLRWGFNNIRIWEGDEHKAAFVTLMGLFKCYAVRAV